MLSALNYRDFQYGQVSHLAPTCLAVVSRHAFRNCALRLKENSHQVKEKGLVKDKYIIAVSSA